MLVELGSELAGLRLWTKATVWKFGRGASPHPVQLRDRSVGKEKLQKSPVRELLEKDVPSSGQTPTPEPGLDFTNPLAPLAVHPPVGHSLHCPSQWLCHKFLVLNPKAERTFYA